MKNKKKFLWGQFIRSVAVIAVPVALQNLLTTTGSMVDTMMIAPLGETTVGAVGLCAQFTSLMFSGYWGFVSIPIRHRFRKWAPATFAWLALPIRCKSFRWR